MFYFLRIIITIVWAYIEEFIQRRKRKDVSLQTHFEMKTFVHLWDLDLYMHMNNAQYLSVCNAVHPSRHFEYPFFFLLCVALQIATNYKFSHKFQRIIKNIPTVYHSRFHKSILFTLLFHMRS